MNDQEHKNQLLTKLLSDDSFASFNSQARARAIRTFERHHRIVRARPLVAIMALALLSLTWPFLPKQRHPANPEQAVSPTRHAPAATDSSFLISDQELLSYFPPGSCSLVQTDGKAFLVFRNDDIKR